MGALILLKEKQKAKPEYNWEGLKNVSDLILIKKERFPHLFKINPQRR